MGDVLLWVWVALLGVPFALYVVCLTWIVGKTVFDRLFLRNVRHRTLGECLSESEWL